MRLEVTTIDEFVKLMEEISNEKEIYIWGAGNFGGIYGRFFNEEKVKWYGYIDSNVTLRGKTLCGKKVYSFSDIKNISNVSVVISVSVIAYKEAYNNICNQLLEGGVNECDIVRLPENYSLVDQIIFFVKKPQKYLMKIRKLKDKYTNKRCFVIGNGPSLKISDLEKLSGEISMGCNNLIQLFDKTEWRPTCFYSVDPIFINSYIKNERELQKVTDNCDLFFTSVTSEIYDSYRDGYNNIFFVYVKRDYSSVRFVEDVENGLGASGTSLYCMIQLAVYMGIKEIYLLGVDFSFRREMRENGELRINNNINNHMNEMEQVETGLYYVDRIMRGWLKIKEYAESHGIKVYNATRGGKLQVFERVDFDSIFA